MRNDAARANVVALSEVSRRHLLVNTAAASVAVAVPAIGAAKAESAPQQVHVDLRALLGAYDTASADLAAAEEDLDWIVAEYRHLWPLAPEEILGAANAQTYDPFETAERDIVGNRLMRETVCLTKRLAREFRREHEITCFHIERAGELIERLETVRSRKVGGRTEKALARNLKLHSDIIGRTEQQIVLAREYEAETSRLREASGVEAIKQRIKEAKVDQGKVAENILAFPATCVADLLAKADFFQSHAPFQFLRIHGGNPLSFGHRLAEDIKRIALIAPQDLQEAV